MTWRLAKSLEIFRAQVNALSPKRATDFDGGVADQRHIDAAKKNPKKDPSDHIPNSSGVVTAFDLTNDPPHEVHCALIAEAIRASKDGRVKYLIFNHFICRSYPKPLIPAWMWAPYTGDNAHDHHLHISVLAAKADDPAPWKLA